MENNAKKSKRGGFYERDLLKKVVREYRNAIAGVKLQFDLLISGALSGNGRKPVKIQPPDFVQIVLIPIVRKLTEMLPGYEVEQFVKDEVEPDDKGYFRIKIGGQVVAGIRFGGVETEYHIKVALFLSNKPWGKPIVVRSMTDLLFIVKMAIQVLDIHPKTSADETA